MNKKERLKKFDDFKKQTIRDIEEFFKYGIEAEYEIGREFGTDEIKKLGKHNKDIVYNGDLKIILKREIPEIKREIEIENLTGGILS